MKNKDMHDKTVRDIIDCAESISKNAYSIVGTEDYLSELRVTIRITPGSIPSINIDRDFYPENLFVSES